MPATRIVMVDDHRILRDGLRVILERDSTLKVVGEAGDVRGAMECIRGLLPDVVVMDLQLPDDSGLNCTRRVVAEWPAIRVLVLSGSPDLSQVSQAFDCGALGYVLKDEAADELVRAVHAVMRGQVYLSPSAATALVGGLKQGKKQTASSPVADLSAREMAVFKYVVDGLRNKEIADRLGVSTKSVETYRARLLEKLGCTNTAELVRFAIREGIATA